MNQSQALAAAVTQHKEQIAAAKRRYTQCIAQLVETPADASLLAELTQLSGTLASTTAGLDALTQALEQVREADATREAEQRKAAGRKRAALVQERAKARRASYERLQVASDAFLEALRNHVDGGEALRAEASGVANAVFGGRADDHLVTAADAAAGTTSADTLAVASVLRDAIEVYGVKRLARYVGADSFVRGSTFAEAFDSNAQVINGLTS